MQNCRRFIFCYILRKTIGLYLDSVLSLTFNTINTIIVIVHVFHSFRYLLQLLEYSACPNGLALYTEKSQTIKMIEAHFYCLYSKMTGSKIIAGSESKVRHPLYVLLVLCCQLVAILARVCHICAFIFEDIVTLLDAVTNKWVRKLVCGPDQDIRNDQVKFAAKNINAKYMYNACKLSVKRGVTFCVVLYRNRWPVN